MNSVSKKMLSLLTLGLLIPQLSFAAIDLNQNASALLNSGVKNTGSKTGLTDTSPEILVGRFIYTFLSIVGVLLVVIVVYAGYLWLTAGGNDDQVAQAKTYLKNAIIGLIITLSAYGITSYVIGSILTATS